MRLARRGSRRSANSIELEPIAAGGWERSVYALQTERFPARWYIAEQRGVVSFYDEITGERATVFDGQSLVLSHEDPGGHYKEEQGLPKLGLQRPWGRFEAYLAYTVGPTPGALVVGALTLDGSGTSVLEEEPREVMGIEQPFSNHNGAHLEFGPDGYLYIGVGDGGSAGDPQNHGQRIDTLLGTILRIDVNSFLFQRITPLWPAMVAMRFMPGAYVILGRFHFDAETGLLWAGDVGQNAYEEIDIIPKGGSTAGISWRVRSAIARYCDSSGMTPPVLTYAHSEGRSVTGGTVYRGREFPSLYGTYIFGDFPVVNLGLDADHGEARYAEKTVC